jgi:hypothetical protein
VAHVCNPNHRGGWIREDRGSKPARGRKLLRLPPLPAVSKMDCKCGFGGRGPALQVQVASSNPGGAEEHAGDVDLKVQHQKLQKLNPRGTADPLARRPAHSPPRPARAPGKRSSSARWPVAHSADTSLRHCVLLPARSTPSNTMSAPRWAAIAPASQRNPAHFPPTPPAPACAGIG